MIEREIEKSISRSIEHSISRSIVRSIANSIERSIGKPIRKKLAGLPKLKKTIKNGSGAACRPRQRGARP